jgi:hypothetical protein
MTVWHLDLLTATPAGNVVQIAAWLGWRKGTLINPQNLEKEMVKWFLILDK